jgi:hypothetical protein
MIDAASKVPRMVKIHLINPYSWMEIIPKNTMYPIKNDPTDNVKV